MADPQDQPNSEPDGASTPPPEKKPPAKAVKKAAKAPAKKAPAKKAPAKKAPAKKAPAKKAPAKAVQPPAKAAEPPLEVQQRIESNGDLTAAAKDAAAQAKSTVDAANNPVSPDVRGSVLSQSPVPLIVALAVSLLAILLIRQLRRH
ncbi:MULTISPECIES: nucleoid-structuring protein H-NS [unclassified Mycobacterium]|uniref:Rv3852 family protein n=1 Tax=unclassified Mycobacterium TaxID=2642494 RepID=UPI0008004FFB|nr:MULTISPECIES: nucleoid-structuring protein H-NS [unclassified Mycobacterium]OBH01847.1 nucleoid-structuring protein H-NS [Mycobacterium sp. E3247]OBI16753.1 nucleoid-structuring protein H-NS [Mycobacterium sp. E2497]